MSFDAEATEPKSVFLAPQLTLNGHLFALKSRQEKCSFFSSLLNYDLTELQIKTEHYILNSKP